MPIFIYDYGDKYDKPPYKNPGMAWDFPENDIPIFLLNDGYIYKATSEVNAKKLQKYRKKINILCENIENKINKYLNNNIYLSRILLFLSLHKEHYYETKYLPEVLSYRGNITSRYLLSEMPKGTPFDGLCKPKMRYKDPNAIHIGKDKNIRALYKDIFLNLDLNEKKLDNLVIHELAHTMANHVQYRPDDHHEDFKWCEKIIKLYWPKN